LKIELFHKISSVNKGYGGRNEILWEEMGCYFTCNKDLQQQVEKEGGDINISENLMWF
jgi:hypothetical protein